MKKLVSLLLALTLILTAVGGFAEAVDTKSALSNLTWKFTQSEYKLYCYWPSPDIFFDSYVLKGLQAFEGDFGQKVGYTVGTEWTQDVENQTVEALAAQGYNLFYIFGADTAGANGLYDELTSAGCKVVNYGGLVDDPQKSALTLCSDVYVQAYNSTLKLIEEMGGEGAIIDVLENLGDVNTLKRQQGVEAAVATAGGKVTIAQTIADIKTDSEGYTKVTDALAANAGVKGIIATGGTASKGLATAMTDYYAISPNAEHISCATMDQSDEVMKALAAGYVDHTVSQNGWGMGYICPLVLMYLSDGWEPITWGQHIDTGYVFITKENIDSWQGDIEALSMKIISSIETEILKKPA
jgi:ribose transport system substrate-binding protein